MMGFVRRNRALTILCLLAIVLLVCVGTWVAVLNHRFSEVPRFEADLDRPGRPERVGTEAMNVLLIGVDDGKGRDLREQLQGGDWVEGSFRSDTIMIWHLSADRDHSQVVSLPRDSWVEVPGYGEAKLNAAFSYGGPELLVHTLEDAVGVYIDHVAVIDFEGFTEVTETLGGVEVRTPDGTTEVLEGSEALDYVRDRTSLPEGDFGRIDRQQHLLRTILEDAVATGRANPAKLTSLIGDLSKVAILDSGFDNGMLRSLTITATRQGAGEFLFMTAPHNGTDTIDGQSVVLLDIEATRELLDAISRDEFDDYRRDHEVDLLPAPDKVQ